MEAFRLTERMIKTFCRKCGKPIYDWKDVVAGVCVECWRERGIVFSEEEAEREIGAAEEMLKKLGG